MIAAMQSVFWVRLSGSTDCICICVFLFLCICVFVYDSSYADGRVCFGCACLARQTGASGRPRLTGGLPTTPPPQPFRRRNDEQDHGLAHPDPG